MNPLNDLLAVLTRDMKAFLTLLEEESAALAAAQSDRLSRLVLERQTLSLGIADHWKQVAARLGMPAQAGFAALRDKALADPAQTQPAAWRELEGLAREASRLNQVNSRLIDEQLRRNQAAMQILQSAAANRGIYGADGRVTDFFNVQRSIDSA
jgi:flagellar biosynthesis/type III secretory pathway chaperone